MTAAGDYLSRSLGDVNASVATSHPTAWRRLLAFAGPAYLVSVGYMDPGNWATDLEAGSAYGYQLLWVLLVANLIAILFQTLSARLGVVARRDLAQACREAYPRPVRLALWVLCEIAIVACDLAEVLGAAVALNLLFEIPLMVAVFATVADTLLLLWMQQYRIRAMEALVLRIIVIVAVCLGMEIFLAKPPLAAIAPGLVPRLSRANLYIVIAMMGATVMPHNLYLHSALVQTRRFGRTAEAIRKALRYNVIDTLIALNGAMLINIALLVLAAAVFFGKGGAVQDMHQVSRMLEPALGVKAAGIIFAVALLSVGQASSLTGTMAGQIAMEGFLHIRMRAWVRRIVTRLLAIVPAAAAIGLYGEPGLFRMLIFSQVVLAMHLPFAVIPLVHFTGDRRRMGRFATAPWLNWTARIVAGVVIVLNVGWAAGKLFDWADTPLLDGLMGLVLASLLPLLGYILIKPRLERSRVVEPWCDADAAAADIPGATYIHDLLTDAQHLSEARFGAFMEQLRGVAFIKDAQGRYIYLNAASATLLDLPVEDALYKTDEEIWPVDLAAIYRKSDEEVLREKKAFEAIEPVMQNGEIRSWLMYKFPIVDGESGQMYIGCIGVDTAGRQQLEDRVLQSRKFELVGRMAGGVAHHFNNLLTVITGYSRMVLDDLGPAHKSRERLEEVLQAADSAAGLTSQLLDFSRRQMLQFRELDLNGLISDRETDLRELLGTGIGLRLELGHHVAQVKGDSTHLWRVLEALAFNARDAMTSGGLLTIATANVQSGRVPCVRLTVSDTGTGMNEETKARLFEPFFTTKKVGEGAGLGLSSVYGIVKQHGGEITVESQPGAGTTFTIFLPVLPPGAQDLRARIVG